MMVDVAGRPADPEYVINSTRCRKAVSNEPSEDLMLSTSLVTV